MTIERIYTRGGRREAPAPEEMSRLSRHPGGASESDGPAADRPAPAASLDLRARGRARRRLRYLRRVRELQLRDLGGLVFDLYRFGEQREALVRAKLDAIIATDKEIAWLEDALGQPAGERRLEVRQPAVGGACANCGAFHGSDARYCATCGAELAVARAAAAADRARDAMDSWYGKQATPIPARFAEQAPVAAEQATVEAPAPEPEAEATEEVVSESEEAAPATEEAAPEPEAETTEEPAPAPEAAGEAETADAGADNGAGPQGGEDSGEVAAVGPRRGRTGQGAPRRRRGSSR